MNMGLANSHGPPNVSPQHASQALIQRPQDPCEWRLVRTVKEKQRECGERSIDGDEQEQKSRGDAHDDVVDGHQKGN
ncbi:unnamed protein product [Mycena citricolor]|uniref:Uncharacterized protein n=1 Tax=Mycena citricolor TaxID=2018698 RepID=A0AAD2HP27_9AGAR|nr:unnamed protein product [Mycena citricolor]